MHHFLFISLHTDFWLLYYSSDLNQLQWKLMSLFSVTLIRSLCKSDNSSWYLDLKKSIKAFLPLKFHFFLSYCLACDAVSYAFLSYQSVYTFTHSHGWKVEYIELTRVMQRSNLIVKYIIYMRMASKCIVLRVLPNFKDTTWYNLAISNFMCSKI